MHRDILSYKNRLDVLFKRADEIDDIETKSHWARYLCVLSCGYLETSVKLILGEYVDRHSHPCVAKYANRKLDYFRSPMFNNIIDLTNQFNREWGESLESETAESIKAAIDSIVNNRHQIAHGKNVGMSLGNVLGYYKEAVKFVVRLDNKCNST